MISAGSGCFCNGREVAKAHIRAAERGTDFEVFVLSGPQATFVELVRVISEITGKKAPNRATPDVVLRAAARVYVAISSLIGKEPRATPEGVAMATQNCRVDDKKAQKELGYAHVPLHDTVRQSYEFLRDEVLL